MTSPYQLCYEVVLSARHLNCSTRWMRASVLRNTSLLRVKRGISSSYCSTRNAIDANRLCAYSPPHCVVQVPKPDHMQTLVSTELRICRVSQKQLPVTRSSHITWRIQFIKFCNFHYIAWCNYSTKLVRILCCWTSSIVLSVSEAPEARVL
jgi:hypothetical protein